MAVTTVPNRAIVTQNLLALNWPKIFTKVDKYGIQQLCTQAKSPL